MANASLRRAKTSFAAGELAPELLGRTDLRAFENGARRLRNVVIQPTGGVARRPGLTHVAMLPGPARLIPFEFNTEQTYLLVVTEGQVAVHQGDAVIATLPAPWTGAMLPQIAFTQSADTLLVFHPDVAPQRLRREGAASWTLTAFPFTREPFHRFAPPEARFDTNGTTGAITIACNLPVFAPGHAGARIRLNGRPIRVTGFLHPAAVTGLVEEGALDAVTGIAEMEESAFSAARGWPVSACFHQDRLVLGGTRDLPNRLFLSRTGDLGDFDPGTGLDDEAVDFALVSDQVNAIRAVFSGRHLQVFTSGAEWMVSGEPLTPASIQVNRQTRIGSPVERMVPPVDVDGATIFAARSGLALHEFAYTEVAQAYQAADLALAARHLVRAPVSIAYDQTRRLLHAVMADGSLATLTLYRAEQVTAWTRQETAGAFRAVAEAEGTVHVVVERAGTHRLERFDEAAGFDAAAFGTAEAPRASWTGLDHLEGMEAGILADGAPRAALRVAGGRIAADPPARAVQAGLPFRHVVEPLPFGLATPSAAAAGPLRLVSASFRLLGTAAMEVDLGRGAQPVAFRRLDTALLDAPPAPFTGDVTLRALGWRRDMTAPLWRVEGAAPLPFTLLSVTTEVRFND